MKFKLDSIVPAICSLYAKLTKQDSCESYLCHAVSVNELQSLGLAQPIKISKSVADCDPM